MKRNDNGEGPRPERRRVPLEVMESLAASMAYRRGQQIYGQKDPAEHWYRVVSGAARKCALLTNGRRQILDFMLLGDFFGFTDRAKHAFAVEAIVEGTIVVRYPRRRLEMLADSDPEFGRLIREMAFETISRLQARILILGQMTALEKVGSFVLEMAERLSGGGSEPFILVMSRYDIADYLALSAETVSRTLTELRHRGAITLSGTYRLRIVDRSVLEEGSDDAVSFWPARSNESSISAAQAQFDTHRAKVARARA
jgi:CRP/FNR family transcriptional regulator, nitrogen fixation regulation protein